MRGGYATMQQALDLIETLRRAGNDRRSCATATGCGGGAAGGDTIEQPSPAG